MRMLTRVISLRLWKHVTGAFGISDTMCASSVPTWWATELAPSWKPWWLMTCWWRYTVERRIFWWQLVTNQHVALTGQIVRCWSRILQEEGLRELRLRGRVGALCFARCRTMLFNSCNKWLGVSVGWNLGVCLSPTTDGSTTTLAIWHRQFQSSSRGWGEQEFC
jgi:hypothetical protein